MIKKIALTCIFFFFLLSFALYIGGVRPPVRLSGDVLDFLRNVVAAFDNWKFEIPDIPPLAGDIPAGLDAILSFLRDLGNAFVMVFNAVIATIQFAITLVIQLAKLIGSIIGKYAHAV